MRTPFARVDSSNRLHLTRMRRPQAEQMCEFNSEIDGVSFDIVIRSSVIHSNWIRLVAGSGHRIEPRQSGSGQFVSIDFDGISFPNSLALLINLL